MRYTDTRYCVGIPVSLWKHWNPIHFFSFPSLLLSRSTITTIVVITIIHFDFHNLFRSNCRIPGPIVSHRRHSLKNESEYSRGHSYANSWARYVVVSKGRQPYPLDKYHQNLLSYLQLDDATLSLEQLGPSDYLNTTTMFSPFIKTTVIIFSQTIIIIGIPCCPRDFK